MLDPQTLDEALWIMAADELLEEDETLVKEFPFDLDLVAFMKYVATRLIRSAAREMKDH